jgi:hypothetical protein
VLWIAERIVESRVVEMQVIKSSPPTLGAEKMGIGQQFIRGALT